MSSAKAALVLEDGTTFEGKPFGGPGQALGETVFYTGVVGYQEVITDPSYRGTVAVMTYPIIGSYGVNDEDNESPGIQVGGIVIREYSRQFSNFRATGALEDFLKEHGVVGVREVDTRAVTVHLREHGEMKGAVASGDCDRTELVEKLKATPSPFEGDLVRELSWEEARGPAGPEKHKVVVLNLGVKKGLLDQLAELGCSVEVVRCTASGEDVLAKGSGGVILAGGPGDPRALGYAVEAVRSLLGKLPVLGIGLGHQVLALALGCAVRRMKAGHRGVNYPVKSLTGGSSLITAQHHGFVVDGESVPDSAEVTHTNVNDGTVEGIASTDVDARSVQFHPCPDEMGRPSGILRRFLECARVR